MCRTTNDAQRSVALGVVLSQAQRSQCMAAYAKFFKPCVKENYQWLNVSSEP